MNITAPRGTFDILPGDALRWHWLEAAIRRVFDYYGYQEIRTPVFEHTELFQRGIGETTDIVEKEMYTFNDKGGRSLTLRPEGTARSEEHTSELQSRENLVCRLLLEKNI